MQMCAWRKPLDVGQSINSRNLEEWLISLTFVSAGSRVCWRALPSSIVFFYRMWLFSFFFLLTQRFPGFENVSSGLYMSHRRLSPRRIWIMWLWRCSLLGFISFSASAVHISFSSNSASTLQRSRSRAVTFMQNSHCLWDLSEVIQGPFLGSGGV